MRQCLGNGTKYVQSYYNAYALSIGTKVDDLGWPWKSYTFEFSRNCASLLRIWGGNNG